MKYNRIILGMVVFGISSISAFEVNTHQAITRCAITTECNQNGAVNLHKFAEDTFLNKNGVTTVSVGEVNIKFNFNWVHNQWILSEVL